jgi:hypothetical protein
MAQECLKIDDESEWEVDDSLLDINRLRRIGSMVDFHQDSRLFQVNPGSENQFIRISSKVLRDSLEIESGSFFFRTRINPS